MSTRYITLLFVLLLAALVPYCYAACYIVPLADDYCMGWEAIRHPDLFSAVSQMYLYWNGRYTADLLVMINPFIHWGNAGYELASLLMILSGILVNYVIARRFITGEAQRWMAALCVQLLFLFQLPDLSEGIYWYNGYMLYYLPGLVFSICIAFVTDIMGRGSWNTWAYLKAVFVPVLILLIAGFNEPMAVISFLFFAGLFVFVWKRYPNRKFYTGLCMIVALLGIILVWRAPGNIVRAGQFNFDRNIVKVLLMSHLQIARFAADWISDLPFIFLSVVVIIRANALKVRWIDNIKIWWIGLAIYLVMLLCVVLPYWFTGVLGQQRTVNMAYCFFLPLAFLLLIKIARSRFVFNILFFMSGERILVSLVAISIVFMMITKNGYKLGYDIAYGTLPKYKAEQIIREEQLRNNLHKDSFRLEPVQNRPMSITLYDERNPKFYWAEKCEKEYLLKREEQSKQ